MSPAALAQLQAAFCKQFAGYLRGAKSGSLVGIKGFHLLGLAFWILYLDLVADTSGCPFLQLQQLLFEFRRQTQQHSRGSTTLRPSTSVYCSSISSIMLWNGQMDPLSSQRILLSSKFVPKPPLRSLGCVYKNHRDRLPYQNLLFLKCVFFESTEKGCCNEMYKVKAQFGQSKRNDQFRTSWNINKCWFCNLFVSHT